MRRPRPLSSPGTLRLCRQGAPQLESRSHRVLACWAHWPTGHAFPLGVLFRAFRVLVSPSAAGQRLRPGILFGGRRASQPGGPARAPTGASSALPPASHPLAQRTPVCSTPCPGPICFATLFIPHRRHARAAFWFHSPLSRRPLVACAHIPRRHAAAATQAIVFHAAAEPRPSLLAPRFNGWRQPQRLGRNCASHCL